MKTAKKAKKGDFAKKEVTKKKLLKISEKYFRFGHFDTTIRDFLSEGCISDEGISYMLDYIGKCQNDIGGSPKGSISYVDMKRTIFRLMGVHDYTTIPTTNKVEFRAIYNFITSLPDEYLSDVNLDDEDQL